MRNWRTISGVVIAGLLLRMIFLAVEYNNLDLDGSFVVHAEVARNVLAGHGIAVDDDYATKVLTLWRQQHRLVDLQDIPPPAVDHSHPLYNDEPGYGLLLAAIWKITGSERWVYVRILQLLIDLVMIVLVAHIGMKLGGVRAGIIASVLYAVFVPGIELVVRPHRDIWVTFAYITSVWILLQLGEDREKKRELLFGLALGILTGLVAWMRSTILLYGFGCAAAYFLIKPARKAIALSVVSIGVFILLLSPLVIRNYDAFGRIMLTRGAFWHSFWAGIGQFENPAGMVEDDQYIATYFHRLDTAAVYGTPQYESFLRQQAVSFVEQHPVWYAGTVLRRAGVILAPKIGREMFFQASSIKTDTGILNRRVGMFGLMAVDGLFVIGFAGGLVLSRKKPKTVLIVLLPLLYTVATLAPFYVVGRNIMNIYFVTLIFASVAAAWLWDFSVAYLRRRGGPTAPSA